MANLESLMKDKDYPELDNKDIVEAINDKEDALTPDVELPSATDNNGKILSVLANVPVWIAGILTNVANVVLHITATATGTVPLTIKQIAGQTANSFELIADNGVVLASIGTTGAIVCNFASINSIRNKSASSNSAVYLNNLGVSIERNVADGNPVVTSDQKNASSTGNIHNFASKGSLKCYVDIDGALVGNASYCNFKITKEGGYAIRLLNKTGANSVKGTVVMVSDTTDNAFKANIIDGDMPIGVVYESGIADGSACWVVVSGIADILLVDNIASTRGYVIYSSNTTAGRIDISENAPAAITHFREIGHSLESKVAGTNVLCKCAIHFN